MTCSVRSGGAHGSGAYAPIPPVLGPVSPSPTRLKSWAGASGTARVPSQTASTDSSGPDIPSSITTRRPASPKDRPLSLASTSAMASSRSVATSTPLPAARPSVLTTQGPGSVRRYSTAGPTSSKVRWRAVGTPALATTSFIHAFDPSSRAPSAPGPSTSRPAARSSSARPATSGASGPMTWASACSRPPDPTTQTRMVTPRLVASRRALDELLAARPHPDEADGHAHLLLEEVEVVAGLGRQVGRLGGPGQVGPPAGELL